MQLPRLRRDQYNIAIHPAKTKILAMGRRWGKSVLGGALVGMTLQQHGRCAWIAPNYKNTRPMWRWLTMALAEDAKAGRLTINKSDRTVETARGGFLGVYSGDNIDSIRGEAFHLIVMDEAARLPEDAWTDVIMPTLADYDGDAVLISTPKGRNWFYNEWQKGRAGRDDIHSWKAPTTDNPMPTIRKAANKVREIVSERTYRQEWLAEFVESGGVFRNIRQLATGVFQPNGMHQHTYIFGIDWGRSEDFTVVTVYDLTAKTLCHIDRYNHIDYNVQAGRVRALAEKFRPLAIVAETNAMGMPILDTMRREGLPVVPFTTTSASKQIAIDALALAFERQQFTMIPDETLLTELEAYTSERLPSGATRYGAPDGMHDDCVMSLAFAWYGATNAGRRKASSKEY